MQPFISGEKPTIVAPYTLANLAGHLALSDLAAEGVLRSSSDAAAAGLARKAAELILPPSADEVVRFARWWTDDMFLATSLLARVAARTDDDRHARVIGRMLIAYARKLQRPDGLFVTPSRDLTRGAAATASPPSGWSTR